MKIVNDDHRLNKYIEQHELNSRIGATVLKCGSLRHFEKDEIIMATGTPLDYYYLIVEGSVHISYLFENGKSVLLKMYHAFNSIGDIELYNNKLICSDVVAAEATYLIALPVDELRNKYFDNTQFLHHLIVSLSDKLSATMNNSSYNLTYPLVNRLSSFLIGLLETEEQQVLSLSMSYQEIAQFLGATYRHLNRTFKELEDKKIIRVDDKQVTIIDRSALDELSRESYQSFL